MSTWSLDADYRYEALRSDNPTALLSAHTSQDAPGSIATACVDAIASHYDGEEVSLLLSQNQGTVRLEMWNYDAMAMRYGGAGESMSCEINRQRFEFARPITVRAFREGDICVEAWGENGELRTRRCTN